MKIETREFGKIEIEEEDIITFCQPIFGFEDYSKFVLLSEESTGSHFAWLQSLEEHELCFILANPQILMTKYSPNLPEAIAEMLGEGENMCWLVTVIAEEFKDSTVNMKSPVFINTKTHRAAQVILEEDYLIRYPLRPAKGEEE